MRKDIFPFATILMDLENIMPSEKRQRERETNTLGYHLHIESKNKFMDIEKLIGGYQRQGGGNKYG